MSKAHLEAIHRAQLQLIFAIKDALDNEFTFVDSDITEELGIVFCDINMTEYNQNELGLATTTWNLLSNTTEFGEDK